MVSRLVFGLMFLFALSAVVSAEVLVLQPDADAGKDSYLKQDDSTRSFGAAATVDVGLNWQDSARRGVLEFDICSLPANATINSVELKLYMSGGNGADRVVNVHKLVRGWVEGRNGYHDDSANWDTYNGMTPWASAGGDYDSSVASSLVVGAKNNFYSWDVANLVGEWYSGTENYGLLMKGEDETGDENRKKSFRSSDYGTAEQRPQLIIDYTGGNGAWCVEPQTPEIPTWHIQYSPTPTSPAVDVQYWNLDLFEVDNVTMQNLKDQGVYVMCYFSAGSQEDWRPDAGEFPSECLGDPLGGWPGEVWADIRCPEVRQIMADRIDLGISKGCDGFDPDNMDAYDNNPGIPLTEQDAIDYYLFMANYVHSQGKGIGLKNALNIIPSVLSEMDWAVNEQCFQYSECNALQPVLDDGKPVFQIEYGGASKADQVCDEANGLGFATLIKNMDLDEFEIPCWSWGLYECGNGVVEPGEVCDSDIINCITLEGYEGTQGCDTQCSGYGECASDEFCGDDIINGLEMCDDGVLNGQPGHCNLQCDGFVLVTNETGVAYDGFEDSWSGGSGWLGEWFHEGDSKIVRNNGPYVGGKHLRLRRSNSYVDRSVDLSAYAEATLSFQAKVKSFEKSDFAEVLISSNGLDWTVLRSFTPSDSDNQYHPYEFDITPFISENVWIAFDAEMSGRGDHLYVDEVRFDSFL